MARIRTIKPEILTDVKAATLSDTAWRLWVSSWIIADDAGRFPADDLILAGQLFPGRPLSEVSGALTEVSSKGLVLLYHVNGERFGEIKGWTKHQKINRPSGPKFPGPSEGVIEDSLNPHGALDADRDRDRDLYPDHDRERDHLRARVYEPGTAKTASDLWAIQEQARDRLKAKGLTGICINPMPGTFQLEPIEQAIEGGFTLQQLEHAIECHEVEAEAIGDARFFDGARNWRPESLRRTAGVTPEVFAADAVKRQERIQSTGGTDKHAAADRAWDAVEREIKRVGSREKPEFEDATTAAVVREMGWRNLCLSTFPAGDKKRFRELYAEARQTRRKAS